MSAFQKIEFERDGLRIIDDQGDNDDNDQVERPKLFSDVAKKNASASSTPAYVVTAGGGNDAAKSRIVQYATRCRLFAAGKCTFGSRCHFRHDVGEDSNGNSSVGGVAIEESVDQECGICMEMVAARGERFGLLLGCVHAFCLSCIREWRAAAQQQRAHADDASRLQASTEAVRSCPVCRVFSPYVIPSVHFVADSERKLQLQDEFLLNTKRTRCRYWNGKPGSCQFGSSCFYQHINPDGTPGVDATRSYADEDGGIHVVPANDRHSLADFIVLPPSQKAAAAAAAAPAVVASQDDEAHLPKWARGLDESDAAQVRQFVQSNSAAPPPSAVSSTGRRPLKELQAGTRGFVELDLSGAPAAVAPPAAAASATVDDWSEAEQAKLEEALRLFPGAASDKERWQSIADHVGRSRKDCVMRFRYCASLQQRD
jgi:hypothetical protein